MANRIAFLVRPTRIILIFLAVMCLIVPAEAQHSSVGGHSVGGQFGSGHSSGKHTGGGRTRGRHFGWLHVGFGNRSARRAGPSASCSRGCRSRAHVGGDLELDDVLRPDLRLRAVLQLHVGQVGQHLEPREEAGDARLRVRVAAERELVRSDGRQRRGAPRTAQREDQADGGRGQDERGREDVGLIRIAGREAPRCRCPDRTLSRRPTRSRRRSALAEQPFGARLQRLSA